MRLAASLLFVCAVVLLPGSAMAADELGLSMSANGPWSGNLTPPLFDPAIRWVPGDTRTASFWVRNQSQDKAVLDVSIHGSSIDALMRTGDLRVSVTGANGAGALPATAGRQKLISARTVRPGQTERIDVTVALDAASTNQSQSKMLELAFKARLTQASSAGSPLDDDSGNDDDSDHNGILPGTGGAAWWVIPAGLLGVTAGWLTLVKTRSKDAADG